MAHAEICPVCKGKGYIREDLGSTAGVMRRTCHGCKGKGWVEVKSEYPFQSFTEYFFIENNCRRGTVFFSMK